MPELSIVIPAYNEEKRIKQTLLHYRSYFRNAEIIVACNACTDGTISIVKNLGFPVRILDIKQPGKGNAIREGFRVATGKIVCYVDADNATVPVEMTKIIRAVRNGNDVAIGSRKIKGSRILVKQPLERQIASWGFSLFIRLLFRIPYKDTQLGAKAFKSELVSRIVHQSRVDGWAFDTEILWMLHRQGYRIQEVPINWNDHKGSKLKLFSAVKTMFLEMFKLRIRRDIWKQKPEPKPEIELT